MSYNVYKKCRKYSVISGFLRFLINIYVKENFYTTNGENKMTESQAEQLIESINGLAEAIYDISSIKGQMGYTIADSLEELALQYWHGQKTNSPKVQELINKITE